MRGPRRAHQRPRRRLQVASTERTNGRRGPARHQERRRQPPRPAPARYAPGRDHERASRTHDAKAQGTPAAPSAATTAAVRGRHGAERQTRACTYLRSAAASQLAPPPRLIRTRPRALVPALALRVLGLGVERESARDLQGRVEGGDGVLSACERHVRRFLPSSGGGLLLLVARAAQAIATERRAKDRPPPQIIDGQEATARRGGAAGSQTTSGICRTDGASFCCECAQAESRSSSLSVGGTKRRRAGG